MMTNSSLILSIFIDVWRACLILSIFLVHTQFHTHKDEQEMSVINSIVHLNA